MVGGPTSSKSERGDWTDRGGTSSIVLLVWATFTYRPLSSPCLSHSRLARSLCFVGTSPVPKFFQTYRPPPEFSKRQRPLLSQLPFIPLLSTSPRPQKDVYHKRLFGSFIIRQNGRAHSWKACSGRRGSVSYFLLYLAISINFLPWIVCFFACPPLHDPRC